MNIIEVTYRFAKPLYRRSAEVRLHNNFAQRVPVLEEQMKVVNHRIEDLEGKP